MSDATGAHNRRGRRSWRDSRRSPTALMGVGSRDAFFVLHDSRGVWHADNALYRGARCCRRMGSEPERLGRALVNAGFDRRSTDLHPQRPHSCFAIPAVTACRYSAFSARVQDAMDARLMPCIAASARSIASAVWLSAVTGFLLALPANWIASVCRRPRLRFGTLAAVNRLVCNHLRSSLRPTRKARHRRFRLASPLDRSRSGGLSTLAVVLGNRRNVPVRGRRLGLTSRPGDQMITWLCIGCQT